MPVRSSFVSAGVPQPLVTRDFSPRVFVYNTRTGQILLDVPVTGTPTWSTGVNQTGGVSVNVPIGGTGLDREDADEYFLPLRNSLAIAYGARIWQAGPILTEAFDDTTNTSTLTATGLWGFLNTKRLLLDYGWTFNDPNALTAFDIAFGPSVTTPAAVPSGQGRSGVSYATIAKRIVQAAVGRTPDNSLPVVFNMDDAAGTAAITYPASDFVATGQRLDDLTALANGPEIVFAPEFVDSTQQSVQHRMNIGSWESSTGLGQSGFPWAFDYGEAIASLGYGRDGTLMTNWHAAVGNGQEAGTLFGVAANSTLPDTGRWPLLEDADRNHTSENLVSNLNSYAGLYLQQYYGPAVSFTATMILDGTNGAGEQTGSPAMTDVREGDTATLNVQGHPRIPDGVYRARLIGFANDGSNLGRVVVTIQGGYQNL